MCHEAAPVSEAYKYIRLSAVQGMSSLHRVFSAFRKLLCCQPEHLNMISQDMPPLSVRPCGRLFRSRACPCWDRTAQGLKRHCRSLSKACNQHPARTYRLFPPESVRASRRSKRHSRRVREFFPLLPFQHRLTFPEKPGLYPQFSSAVR